MITAFYNKHFRGLGGINELFAVAMPLFISSSCETFMLFTDRYFLSKLGPEYMSASLAGGFTSFMFCTFFFGVIDYGTALVAQYLGANITKKCPVVLNQMIIISFIAYPVMILCIPLGFYVFETIKIPPEQIKLQEIYFKMIMMGSLLSFVRHSMSSYFSGIGRTKIIMFASFLSLLVNVFATYALVFGKWGLPELGIMGAGIGSIIGNFFGIIPYIYIYFEKKNRIQFRVLESFKFDRNVVRKILKFGYPAGLEFFLSVVAFNFFVMTFQSYNIVVSTSVTIMFNWENVSFIPLLGVNTALTSLVGRYVGAKDYNTAHKMANSGLKIVFIYSLVGMFCFSVFAENMVDFFSSENNNDIFLSARPLAVFMIRTVSLYLFADAFGLVYSGALRGAGDTFVPMCISVVSSWLMFFITVLLVRYYIVSPKTVWICTIFFFWSFNTMFYFRYKSGKWREIKVI